MFRLLFLTFFGTQRYDEHHVHVHESPKNMTIPLIVLAILSVCGGWMAAPQLCGRRKSLRAFPRARAGNRRGTCRCGGRILRRRRRNSAGAAWRARDRRTSRLFPGVVVLHQEPGSAEEAGGFAFAAPYKLLSGKYFIDELYAAAIVRPLVWISDKVLWHVVDERAIDGTVNGVALRFPRIGRPPAPR